MKLSKIWLLLALFISVQASSQHRYTPNWSITQNQPNVASGGRANSIAVHPWNRDLMFVASDTGGLFQSASGGVFWTHHRGFPTFTQSVVYVPGSPNVVLVSTKGQFNPGFGGGGVWRSTDGGAGWSRAPLNVPGYSGFLHAYEISAAGSTIAVATSEGVFVSTNAGASWDWSNPFGGADRRVFSVLVTPGSPQRLYAGGPGGVRLGTPGGAWVAPTIAPNVNILTMHAFGSSPLAPADHAFVASRERIYRTTDRGSTWTELSTPALVSDCGGTPFLKAATRNTGGVDYLDLYHGNTCGLHRLAVRLDQSPLNFSVPWEPLSVDHDAPRDLAFFQMEPVLLATNGGLHKTANLGQTWTFAGGGSAGYTALQIAEVTGQYVRDPENPRRPPVLDLYLGTQDNNLLAIDPSGNELARQPAEGFFLSAERKVPSPEASKLTYVACRLCRPVRSDRYFANALQVLHSGFRTAAPVLFRPGQYLQNVASGLDFSDDPNLFSWEPFATFPEAAVGIPKVAWTNVGGDAVVYQPVGNRLGAQLLRIERFGNPNVIRMPMNEIAVNPLMTDALYPVYAVDPLDWRHLIAADKTGEQMASSTDGGHTWTPLPGLTNLVKYGSIFRFLRSVPENGDVAPLVTAISFHPADPSQVLAGTSQGGVYFSADRGVSWARITDSAEAESITSFFWASLNTVYVSTFGRGLWRLNNVPVALPERFAELCPACQVVSLDGTPGPPPFDSSLLVYDGSILGVRRENGRLREVFIGRGSSFVFTGHPKELKEAGITVTESGGDGAYELLPSAPKGRTTTGVVFTNDEAVTGTVIVEGEEMSLPPPPEL